MLLQCIDFGSPDLVDPQSREPGPELTEEKYLVPRHDTLASQIPALASRVLLLLSGCFGVLAGDLTMSDSLLLILCGFSTASESL